jgi:hypothetical protein
MLNEPAIKFQIYWQRYLLQENKRHKQKLEEKIKKAIAGIDTELKDRF